MGTSGKKERNFPKETLKKQAHACFPEYGQADAQCPKMNIALQKRNILENKEI